MARSVADVNGTILAVKVKAVEGGFVDDEAGDLPAGPAGNDQIRGLAEARTDEFAARGALMAGVLVEPRRDSPADGVSQGGRGEAVGQRHLAEPLDQRI